MPAMMEFEDRKWRDREALKHIIGQWNANRLDLFSLSEPNEVSICHSLDSLIPPRFLTSVFLFAGI
jgi:hypothetical protein